MESSTNLEEDCNVFLDELMECDISFYHYCKTFETQNKNVNEYERENNRGIKRAKSKYDDIKRIKNMKFLVFDL